MAQIPVLVVADAGPGVGLGHVSRCAAVAMGLQARGVACRLLAVGATQAPHSALEWECAPEASAIPRTSPPLLLVDSYQLAPGSLRTQTGARRLACMHDVGPLPEGADFTLTTDPALVGARPGVVGGLALTCLGPAYWGLPDPPEPSDQVRRALVTMGGGDPGGHAVAVAQTVREALGPGVEVTVVRGPQASFADPPGLRVLDRPPSLLASLRAADLTVTACGSSLLEALAVGTPTIGVVVAANQRPKAEEIARQGATELCEPAARETLARAVGALAADPCARRARSRAGRELVDGYGALRVAYRLSELLSLG